MKLEHTLTLRTKINSKCVKDLNIRHDTMKLLEENTGKTFSDINWFVWHQSYKCFLRSVSQGKRNKNKNKPRGPNQTYKFCTAKETIKKPKKTTYGMGENSCQWCNWQGLNIQNIQTTQTTQQQQQQQQNPKQPKQKMGRRTN